MGSGIALTDAAVMSTVLEGILYGFSLLMFIGTMWALAQQKHRGKPNLTMMLIATILFILSTTHMVIDIIRIDEGLVKHANTFPGGSLAFFEDIAQKTFVIKNVIYSLQTLLGDGVVIYRCYIVWQSVWVIILPSMLWCGVAVTAFGSVYSISKATTNDIFFKHTREWITAFFVLTLTTNLLSSGLLAYRIWTVKNNFATILVLRRYTSMPIVRVLVDAALLYSATLFVALICFVNSNNGQYVVLDMITPIISITFYMVLIRVAFCRKKLHCISSTAPTGRGTPDGVEPQDTTYDMKPLQVHISRFSKINSDSMSPCRPGNRSIEREDWGATCKVETDSNNIA